MKDITLITCSYNTPDVTLTMLRSFARHHPGKNRVLLMENSTNEDTANLLDEENVPYIRSPGLTHGDGVNKLLELCETKYALLVDTDIIFKKSHEDIFEQFKENNLCLLGNIEMDKDGERKVYLRSMQDPSKYDIKRLHKRVDPWHCFINVEMVKNNNIKFFDEQRMKDSFNSPCRYDIGSTFFEDVNNAGLRIGNIDLSKKYYDHMEGMSWYSNKFDPSKGDTGIDFGGTHNNPAYVNIHNQKEEMYKRIHMHFSDEEIKNRFISTEMKSYKLGVAYNLFDGEETLRESINSIRDNVDYITVTYQTKSNVGKLVDYNVKEFLDGLKKEKLIDAYHEYYSPSILSPHVHEIAKRNMGLNDCIEQDCTHFMSMDVDEVYKPEKFKHAKETIINGDYDSSACQMITYYKSNKYYLDPPEDHYVSFIFKIEPNKRFVFAHPFPVEVDPTRRMPTYNCKLFSRKELQMHHLSYVRNDLSKKLSNSSASVNFIDSIDEVVEHYNNWEYGKQALIAGKPNRMWDIKCVDPGIPYTLQNDYGLERYISLDCVVNVDGNVSPVVEIFDELIEDGHPDLSPETLFREMGRNRFGVDIDPNKINLKDYAFIETKTNIRMLDEKKWKQDPLYREYSKYASSFDVTKCDPIILAHPNVISLAFNKQAKRRLYMMDGAHRVMSALDAGVDQIDALILVRRRDIKNFIDKDKVSKIHNIGAKCSWFPRYQEIIELGIEGQRVYDPRYTSIYDFSCLTNKTVVDFGGNIGQASIEARFNRALDIYNFDYQIEAINTAKEISKILGLDIENNTIDFNKESFESDVKRVVETWDWCIFQAIYRTKEINDIEKNFDFIVKNTKEGIIFEGNGEPTIDTDEFYQNIFKKYNFSEITYLGHSQQRPAYILRK